MRRATQTFLDLCEYLTVPLWASVFYDYPLRLHYFLQELRPKNMYLRRNATELKALITEGTSATLQLLEAVSFDIDFLFRLSQRDLMNTFLGVHLFDAWYGDLSLTMTSSLLSDYYVPHN